MMPTGTIVRYEMQDDKVWHSHVTRDMVEVMGLNEQQVAEMVQELDDAVMHTLNHWGLD